MDGSSQSGARHARDVGARTPAGHRRAPPPPVVITLLALGALGLAGLAVLYGTGQRMWSGNAPLIDAAMEIKYEAATFHLRLEKALEEPSDFKAEEVWAALDRARWYTDAMLNGGENPEGRFIALENDRLRLAIVRTDDALARLRLMAETLLVMGGDNPRQAQEWSRFELAYATATANADLVETGLQDHLAAQQRAYTWLAIGLAGVMVLSMGLGVAMLARVQRRRLTAEEDLRRSNADLERFAHVAAHDLKEPVRTMAGFSRLLRLHHHDALPAEGQEYLTFIEDAAERLQRMISHLLDLARLTSEAAPSAQVDLAGPLMAARDNLSSRIEELGATVAIHGTPPTVMGNDGQLTVLFQNLINNALKFQPQGNVPRVDVTISATDDPIIGAAWRFDVRDNGIGIPAEETEQVFQYFRRGGPAESFAGTGLGLAVCRRIADRHGGRIWAVTHDGADAGTTISVVLPR